MTKLLIDRAVVEQWVQLLEKGDVLSEVKILGELRAALAQPPKLKCGVDLTDGVLTVTVIQAADDGVMEVIHSEQIEIAQPVVNESLTTEKPLTEPVNQEAASTCSEMLRKLGKVYQRTCKKCGLGPCNTQTIAQAQPAKREQLIGCVQHDCAQCQAKREPLYTAQALRDVLERAARKCEEFGKTLEIDNGSNFAEEIRAMIKEIPE